MRNLFLVLTMSFLAFALANCSIYKGVEKTKVEMRKGSKAECNRLKADRDRFDKIEPDLTEDQKYAECLKIQEDNLGISCTFIEEIDNGRGRNTTREKIVDVDETYCDAKP